MIIVTTDEVAGYRIEEVLGETTGMLAQRAYDLRSGWSGDAHMTQLIHGCRNEAMNRLWIEAARRGANAIVGMRYDVSTLGQTLLEVCAYGTAVVIRPLAEGEPGATTQSIKQALETGGGPAAPDQPSPNQHTPQGRPSPPGQPATPRHPVPPHPAPQQSAPQGQPPGAWPQPPGDMR